MTLADLPTRETRRWVPRRKARVVAAVEGGLISEQEACDKYEISAEEFKSWKSALTAYGLKGLCVTQRTRRSSASE